MAENYQLSYDEQKLAAKFTYEVSLWTLQDSFITVLKWAYHEAKGQIQQPEIKLSDDGTREFSFSIPKVYYNGLDRMLNPLWHQIEELPIEANMHKLKVIFNKNTEDEAVEEFLVTSVTETHEQDNIVIEVSAEGLAFHELGKVGYKIALSADNFNLAVEDWFSHGQNGDEPKNNIQYWNDLVFKDDNGNWKSDWQYYVQMDWSSYSQSDEKRSDVIYEDEYISSWDIVENNYLLQPRSIERYKEKLRLVDAEESNIYNITQDIAKAFGVFCRYQYEHDEQYHITGKKVIYYNNYWQETNLDGDVMTTHLDLTYPYSSSSIKRTIDSTDVITKMYVRTIDSNAGDSNVISIMGVEANKSKEDYILNFDYLHEIGTISDDQYDEISTYEAKMHQLNKELIEIEQELLVLLNDLTEAQAKVTFYTNAVQLDQERYDAAIAARNAITGGGVYIYLDEINPGKLYLKNDTIGDKGYYVDISYEGVDPGSMQIYETINTRVIGENRLTNLNDTGRRIYDEFHNLVGITNIDVKTNPRPSTLYLVGRYSPSLYYEKIADTWLARRAQDEQALQDAKSKENYLLWQIYGSRADFARVDAMKIGGEHLNTVAITSEVPNVGTLVGQCRVWGLPLTQNEKYSFEDVENFTLDLAWREEEKLREKQQLIASFERMMGPALREGYWQPEDYNDYGDRYLDYFGMNVNIDGSFSNGDLLSFSWDCDKLYDGEEGVLFQSSVDGTMEQYLIIDLTDNLDKIVPHIKDLSFIYYDKNAVDSITQIIQKQNNLPETPVEQWSIEQQAILANELASLKKSETLIRSFTIGGQCEFGFIRDTSDPNVTTMDYKPVLIITGSTLLTADEIAFIKSSAANHTQWAPFLGYYLKDDTDKDVIKYDLEKLVENLTLIGDAGIELTNVTRETYSIQRVYPRIFINSLKLKDSSDELFINLNRHLLQEFTDYTVLVDERGESLSEYIAGYYITIKPEAIIEQGDNRILRIDISFVLSNADVSIYLDALKIMKENAYPKVSYEVALCALNFSVIRIAYTLLNHIVHINDTDLQLQDVSGYISAVTIPLDKVWETSIEIKNYETKFEDLFTTIVAQTESMKKNEHILNTVNGVFTPIGNITDEVLQNSIMRADLNYSFNQGTLTIDQENGIWGTSDDGVVAFRGGGIFTATKKDENDNWVWNTGILPSGINANLITTGQLDTNKIKVYAGDQVRFQLNGEGLFAYKSRYDDIDLQLTSEKMGIYEENYSTRGITDIDPNQYVVLNSQGLFLVAKNGAMVFNEDKTDFSLITKPEVKRVEISWDGLILRNNNNERVFYADNNGNLTLSGTIQAKNGEIGGWTINENFLGSRYINLVSKESEENNNLTPGIYLINNNSIISSQITYNNETYYGYVKTGTSNDDTIYYYKPEDETIDSIMVLQNDTNFYKYETQQARVYPRYTCVIITDVPDHTEQGDETSYEVINKIITVCVANEDGTAITYNGDPIQYDNDNLLKDHLPDWYNKLLHVKNNIANYVTYEEEEVLVSITLSNVTLRLQTFNPTFSVKAETGEVSINSGTIGNFNLSNQNLTGNYNMSINSTNLNGNNRIDGNANYTLSKYKDCFCAFESNSNNGTFTLTTVGGVRQTFNIASTNFFKTKLAEAGQLEKGTVSYSDGVVRFSVKSGYGNTYSKSYRVGNLTDSYNAGWNACRNSMLPVSVYGFTTSNQTKSTTCPRCGMGVSIGYTAYNFYPVEAYIKPAAK